MTNRDDAPWIPCPGCGSMNIPPEERFARLHEPGYHLITRTPPEEPVVPIISVALRFRPRDLWVGLYVGQVEYGLGQSPLVDGHRMVQQFRRRSIYICIIPMLPIVVTKTDWGRPEKED